MSKKAGTISSGTLISPQRFWKFILGFCTYIEKSSSSTVTKSPAYHWSSAQMSTLKLILLWGFKSVYTLVASNP